MKSLDIKIKTNPVLKDALRGITRRHTCLVTLVPDGTVTVNQPEWSGGSKESWHFITKNGAIRPVDLRHAPWPSSAHTTVTIPARTALVECGIFLGKPAFAHLFINADEAADWDLCHSGDLVEPEQEPTCPECGGPANHPPRSSMCKRIEITKEAK